MLTLYHYNGEIWWSPVKQHGTTPSAKFERIWAS